MDALYRLGSRKTSLVLEGYLYHLDPLEMMKQVIIGHEVLSNAF